MRIVEERKSHIERLCAAHKIEHTVRPGAGDRAFALPAERQITTPPVTGIRSYFIALHEIAHVVLSYDYDQLAAPQEAEAWTWAIDQAAEPPSEGLRRHMFKVVWHYVLRDLSSPHRDDMSNRSLFRPPDDPLWSFLGQLDDPERLLYEATKLTARTTPPADELARLREQLYQVGVELDDARQHTRDAVRKAIQKEQLRTAGPPRPAKPGDAIALGRTETAHILRYDGMLGTRLSVYCGASGIARPALNGAALCKGCQRLVEKYPPDAVPIA